MIRSILVLSMALTAFVSPIDWAPAANIADFVDYSLKTDSGQTLLPGRLYVPEAAAFPRPLIVFLHGGGAIASDNITQVLHTPDYLLDEAKRRGAYLYVPQTSTGWSSLSHIDSVATMIDRLVDDGQADARRLYATGYSNGGGGTWNLLSRNSDTFAAALVVAGVAPAAGYTPANLLTTPIFALHARDDATVTVQRSRAIVAGILTAAGERPPTYPSNSTKDFLVYNPSVEFHQNLAPLLDPNTTALFTVSHPDADLLYYEGVGGGHTGPLGIYYSPIAYDWMFSHLIPAPEPVGLTTMALCAGVLLTASRRVNAAKARKSQLQPQAERHS
jgi:poly(3-hydroxybutyrate) depolymerase